MEFSHKSVLLGEVIELMGIMPDGTYVDGTFGGAGHSFEIARRLSPAGHLIGIDRDDDALDYSGERLKGLSPTIDIIKASFEDIPMLLETLKIPKVNGILLDLGVSSFQLDEEERGFSYMQDEAPLDMRMDRSQGFCAKDVVNGYSRQDLAKVIRKYGEDRFADNIAKHIEKYREKKPVETCGELARIVKQSIPMKIQKTTRHPEKRTFQAIRIEVNRELEQLERSIGPFIDLLEDDGRLCIITFHSLEDRIVKKAFREYENPCICPPDFPVCVCGRKSKGKALKSVTPSEEEVRENNRSHSARLRVFVKGKKGEGYGHTK